MDGTAGAFGKGSTIRFEYPAANYKGVRPRWEVRCMRVEHVRPLCEQPLADITLELDPHLNRGEVLVTGHDLDKDAERSFYLDRMQHIETVSVYDDRGEACESTGDSPATTAASLQQWFRSLMSPIKRRAK